LPEKIDIVTTIAGAGQPITLTEVAKALGSTSTAMGTQIKRLKTEGLVDETEKDRYILSDAGGTWLEDQRVKARRLLNSLPAAVGIGVSGGRSQEEAETEDPPDPPGEDDPPPPPPGSNPAGPPQTRENSSKGSPLLSEAGAQLTDYDFFFQLGIALGLSENLAAIVTAHVWRGGKYDDLKWVRNAFGEMQVRADIASRWWQAWRTHLDAVAAPEMIHKVAQEGRDSSVKLNADSGSDSGSSSSSFSERKKTWTHVIQDGTPAYVGEGHGDMTYDDALELSKSQAASRARGSGAAATQPQSSENTLQSQVEILKTLVELITNNNGSKAKAYMVSYPEEGGGPTIEEVEPGKPIAPPAPRVLEAPAKTFLVNEKGETEEIEPGRPYIKVIHAGPQDGDRGGGRNGQPIMFFNPNTQMIEPWDPSKGPIIINPPKQEESKAPVIQVKGADGELMTLPLSVYFQLEEHKEQMQQKRQGHEMRMGMAKDVRGLITKGMRAFGRMSGEEEGLGSLEGEVPAEDGGTVQ
jgi:biotin operon repressor